MKHCRPLRPCTRASDTVFRGFSAARSFRPARRGGRGLRADGVGERLRAGRGARRDVRGAEGRPAVHGRRAVDGREKLLRISARSLERDGRSFVRLEFYDNGVGIRREDLERVYDPFYTTRRDTGGTGLGLSISFGIVREHGGTVRAESERGEFARFIVELPAAGPEADAHA